MAASHPATRQIKTANVTQKEALASQNALAPTHNLLLNWITGYHKAIVANENWLTELDRAIGDGDHGTNMRRGMDRVMEHRGDLKGADLSTQLRMISGHLTASIGGASGPLYGAFFLHASCVVSPRHETRIRNFTTCLEAGLQGVVGLGHAIAGDKTMVDVLIPIVSAYKSIARRHVTPAQFFSETVQIAEAAMKSTISMQARKGRASYLGARSIGHQDPGATSMFLLMRTLAEAATKDPAFTVQTQKSTTRKLIP